jgi:YihY family inner membrane protein
MSTANLVPETWHLTGDDAKETLTHTDRTQLVKDAVVRLRYSDGFSHARSMAFLVSLVFVQGVIAAVGIASALGAGTLSAAIVKVLQTIVPGPAGRVLTDAVQQAHQAGSSSQWIAIVFGTVGALITGTTLMGQIERALNRLYGIERDRPTVAKYTHAFVLAVTAGTLTVLAFAGLALGDAIAGSLGGSTARTIWNVVRWPIGIALLVAAIALIFRWSPRRRQPAWSWLSFGAVAAVGLLTLVTLVLNLFFRFSTTFGATYGPLAGIIALAFWSFLSAVALLMGAALAAQLEAVRAGVASPDSAQKMRESEPQAGRDEAGRPIAERVS